MSGLCGLFNGLVRIVRGAAASFPIRTGDVNGLFTWGLKVGDDVKKFGGLELGAGEDERTEERAGAPYDTSIEQSLKKPGELGGRGDVKPGGVAGTGLVKSDEFDCSVKELSAQDAEISPPGDSAARILGKALFRVMGGETQRGRERWEKATV